jgi:hypothetical protein
VRGQQFVDVGEPFGEDVAAAAEPVDEAQRERLLRAGVPAAEDQIEGRCRADQTRRALRAARARQQAELHFGQSELRAVDGDAVVRGERDFQAAAERGAVNRGDDRLGTRLDAVAHVRQRRRHRRFAELADIRARDEVAPRADDQHGFDGVVGVGGFDRGEQAPPHVGGQRVDRRVIDGHQQHLAAQFTCDNVGRGVGGHGVVS